MKWKTEKLRNNRQLVVTLLLVGCGSLLWSARGGAQESLIDHEPYDLLILKAPKHSLKLVPLEMAPRRPLRAEDRRQPLIVRLLTRPDQKYSVQWSEVERVRLYEELILEEAAKLVEQNQFDAAHRCYQFLLKYAPEFPGLKEGRADCLFREAQYWQSLGRFQNALAILEELHDQDARYPGLASALGVAVDRLVTACLADDRAAAARTLLASLAAKFPQHPVVKQRQAELVEHATKAWQEAREHHQARRMRQAHDAVDRALSIWPDLEAARTLDARLRREYPLVRVAVQQLSSGYVAEPVASWPDLRTSRLVDTWLAEPVSWTASGGVYASHAGQWTDADEQSLTFTLRSDLTWNGSDRPLTAQEVARSLLSRGTHRPWQAVTAVSTDRLSFTWPDRPPWWQAWLRLPPTGWPVGNGVPRCGVYALGEANAAASCFVRPAGRGTADSVAVREVVERLVPDARAGIRALRRASVLAYDRVPPWQLALAARQSPLRLLPYAAPTVHLLVLNPRRAPMSDLMLRRALVAALDRPRALQRVVGEHPSADGRLISGPFPWGYAYEETIRPRPYDPRLAAALWRSGTNSASSATQGLDTLILVHSPSPVAERAARVVAQQWNLDGHGPRVQLRPASGGELARPDASDWDVYLLEWHAMEPLVDALTLFGPQAICSTTDCRLNQLAAQLARATTRADAEATLHELHRAVHERLPVIGLWQFQEHALLHPALTGCGQRPISLYQNVADWRIKPSEQAR